MRKILQLIKVFIIELFHPETWLMFSSYSENINNHAEKILREELIFNIPEDEVLFYQLFGLYTTIYLNNQLIWVGNKGYGLFFPKEEDTFYGYRPSRANCRKIYKVYLKYLKDNNIAIKG